MASTSTNKQPLLVDRVLHYVVDTSTAVNAGINVAGGNTAVLLVNALGTDGCIIEDIYTVSRGAEETVNLYISTANDYMRPNESLFLGQFKSSASAGTVTRFEDMPRTLTPVPYTGTEKYNQALYIPKGRALWAARDSSTNPLAAAPFLGCQGGWY